jgi:hypothetical protein
MNCTSTLSYFILFVSFALYKTYTMRKHVPAILIIACIAFCSISAPLTLSAQNPTPNAGFEEWTEVDFFGNFFIPNSWDNLDSATALLGILTCQRTTDAHSGSYAVKLVTYAIVTFNDTVNGIVTTGNLIITPPYGIEGGIPYTERPDSISCWVKYQPVGGDSTMIQFSLLEASGDTVGMAILRIGATVSNYTRFSAPVNYYSAATPSLSRWMMSSSNGYKAIPGSTLYIDDLSLLFTTGVEEVQNASGMQIVNSLVTDQILLTNPKNYFGQFRLYDAMGSLQLSYPVTHSTEQYHLPRLANGMYYCAVVGDDGAMLLQKKIVVQQ